jgi:hypothetical protein
MSSWVRKYGIFGMTPLLVSGVMSPAPAAFVRTFPTFQRKNDRGEILKQQ